MEFADYAGFWPYYVAQHSRPATRWIHLVGTLVGLAAELAVIATAQWYLLWLWPVIAYPCAWFAHFVIEKNTPATFGHPLWSLRGDWQMIAWMLTGRDRELTRIARATPALLARTPAS